jgi:two-component system, cell cycle sensor histidine kinase and response regulator CckA
MYPRIIIIDDMPVNAELFKEVCVEAGFTNIWTYFDPVQALREIKIQGKPDLVLTDYHMPGKKGTEVIYELETYFRGINAAVITGDPLSVKFIGKQYPILEKGIAISNRLLKFLQSNLKPCARCNDKVA